MLKRNSLFTSVAVGKAVGFVIGLAGFVCLSFFAKETSLILRFGVLFWYTTLGAIIGVFGVFTWHPILRLPLPWWFRSFILGTWMNFVLMLFTYDQFKVLAASVFGETSIFVMPYWMLLEGAVSGLLIGCFATKFGGEGRDIVDVDPRCETK